MKKILSKPLCFRKLGRSSDMQNDALIHLEGLKGLHIGFLGTVVLSVCPKCLSLTSCQKVAYTMLLSFLLPILRQLGFLYFELFVEQLVYTL